MEPLDLIRCRPRRVRETLLGFYFVPRTIDKLRAELPGGNLGPFLNEERGLSAYVVRRLGLHMNAFREAVAAADRESDIARWIAERIDIGLAPEINAKLESFVVERMTPEDQDLLRARHPIMHRARHPSRLLDIIDADDEAIYAAAR